MEAIHRESMNSCPSVYVSHKIWKDVEEYLMEEDHPIKERLDLIFSTTRALCDQESMEAAGFKVLPPQHHTHMIVAKHPMLEGYVIKAYYDEQPYFKGRPEHFYWIRRIKGAKLISKYIKNHSYDSFFKVPKKWIYLLPDEPSPPKHYLRKLFILIAEDMGLYDDETNKKLWGSTWVTKQMLKTLYAITTDLGLLDSAKPANCSFSLDGKAAFIDTELYHRSHVRYDKLTLFLSPPMQEFWKDLTENSKQ